MPWTSNLISWLAQFLLSMVILTLSTLVVVDGTDGHHGTVHILLVRFLCGGYNSTSTPVVGIDGHVDTVGSCNSSSIVLMVIIVGGLRRTVWSKCATILGDNQQQVASSHNLSRTHY
jgi:hypothetical protein